MECDWKSGRTMMVAWKCWKNEQEKKWGGGGGHDIVGRKAGEREENKTDQKKDEGAGRLTDTQPKC